VIRLRWIRSDISSIVVVGLLTQVLTVVSGPLVARMLGPSGRGDLVMSMLVSIIVAHLASTSVTNGVAAVVAAHHSNARDLLGRTMRTWVLLSIVPTVVAGVAAWFLLPHAPHRPIVAAETAVITFLACVLNLRRGMLQGEHAIRTLNVSRIAFAATYVGIVVVLFVTAHVGSAATVLPSQIAAQCVALAIGTRGIAPRTAVPDAARVRAVRREVHTFARRAYLSSLGTTDLLGLDSLLVGLLLGNTALGLYSVAASTSTLPVIALTGLSSTLLPRMTAREPAAARSLMRRWLLAGAGIAAFIALLLEAVIAPALRIFFGSDFVPSTDAARLLIIAFAISGVRFMSAAAAQALGLAKQASAIEVAAGVIMVVSVIVGAHLHGVTGAAAAMLLTQAFNCGSLLLLLGVRRPADPAPAQRESTTSTL
jgi:O-antigen/teichoic acid export membrane protein